MNDELATVAAELEHMRGALPSRLDVDQEGLEQGLAQKPFTRQRRAADDSDSPAGVLDRQG